MWSSLFLLLMIIFSLVTFGLAFYLQNKTDPVIDAIQRHPTLHAAAGSPDDNHFFWSLFLWRNTSFLHLLLRADAVEILDKLVGKTERQHIRIAASCLLWLMRLPLLLILMVLGYELIQLL